MPSVVSKEKYTGGAILPTNEKKSPTNIVAAESAVPCQPSRKYRKVEVPEEASLDAEELQVLKAFNKNSAFVPDDDDDECLDGLLDSPLWEARASSNAFAIEDEEQDQFGSPLGSYYDSMFGMNGSYDSNYAYGSDLISDAEVLTALGYPQPPTQPSKRTPVLCYCGCRLNPSEAHKHNHTCRPRQGIFSMPGAVPLGTSAANNMRSHKDERMSEAKEEPVSSVIGSANDDNTVIPANNGMASNNNNTNFMVPNMTPIPSNNSSNWNTPMQSGPIQSAPPGMSGPFHVPDSAPVSRPRIYRPFMQNVS